MAVKLGSITTVHALSEGNGRELHPYRDIFAVASVTLTNKQRSPQHYNPHGQMTLSLPPDPHPDPERVESLPGTCVRRAGPGAPLMPGHSVTCNVLFDIDKTPADRDLAGKVQRGELIVVNFGDSPISLIGSTALQPVGAIYLGP